jgi:wobble nucleotide-excising tRNase
LCYNAFVEDSFIWNNEDCYLSIQDFGLSEFIKEQGLESGIVDNFKKLTNSKIEPRFDSEYTYVSFINLDAPNTNIKISKGEESIFIWSIFYTQLALALITLTDKKGNRSTHIFNDLEYVVIDDPVSSIDDTRIIGLALELKKLIEKYYKKAVKNSKKVRFLITTHHALFYNVLYNGLRDQLSEKANTSLRDRENNTGEAAYVLSKNSTNTLDLKQKGAGKPFTYHLSLLKKIKEDIHRDDIQRYHFNMFRCILEKTSIFLGYGHWHDCLSERSEFLKKIDLYSHDDLSDMEYERILADEEETFKVVFSEFVNKFNFKL